MPRASRIFSSVGASMRKSQLQALPSAKPLVWIAVSLVVIFCTAAERPDPRFRSIGSKLLCSCGCKQALLQCNHSRFSLGPCETALNMRGKLLASLKSSASDDAIVQKFVSEFGVAVMGPPVVRDETNTMLWVIGALVLAGTGMSVFMVSRRRRVFAAAAGGAPVDVGGIEEMRKRVRSEIEEEDR